MHFAYRRLSLAYLLVAHSLGVFIFKKWKSWKALIDMRLFGRLYRIVNSSLTKDNWKMICESSRTMRFHIVQFRSNYLTCKMRVCIFASFFSAHQIAHQTWVKRERRAQKELQLHFAITCVFGWSAGYMCLVGKTLENLASSCMAVVEK